MRSFEERPKDISFWALLCTGMYPLLQRDNMLTRLLFIRNIFNYLFPPLVQERLNEYREYWNNHRITSQRDKSLPSGYSPRHVFTSPSSVRKDALRLWVRVNPASVDRWRTELGGAAAHREATNFVTQAFQAEADQAWIDLGCPRIQVSNVWDIFSQMVVKLRDGGWTEE